MHFSGSPAFSISKSLKKSISDMSNHNPIVPGPIYEVTEKGRKEPNLYHSIGKSKRTQINHRIQQTPAPAHYQPLLNNNSLSKTFPKSSFIQELNLNPDPACYIPDHKHAVPKVLTYTLTSRQPSIMDQNNRNPGPGHYQHQELPILTRSKSNKETFFGKDSRFRSLTDNAPGVGQYNISQSKLSQFQQKYSIGKGNREPEIKLTPGPADYPKMSFAQQNIKYKLGKSMSGRFKQTFQVSRLTNDAFNKYFQNPEHQFADQPSSPKYSIGKQKRQMFKGNPNPSPVEYINDDFMIKHSSAALIPQAQNGYYDDSIFKPGPGTYQIQTEQGIKYSFPKSKSISNITRDSYPGVGRYQLNNLKSVHVNSFSKEKRFNKDFRKIQNPTGVGEYEISQKLEHKGTIGKSSRFKVSNESSPGPGDYHIHSLMGYKSQAK